jgi:RNA polymerase sigma-70 factor, ECF subfamily
MEPSTRLPSPDEIVRELSGPLRRYLARYAGDAALAEDLLQETLLRITRSLPGFAGRASLKTWAFAIATRVAADHFRAPAHRLRVIDIDESSEVPCQEAAIDQRLVADEMNACVREVIDSLPEDYRAALVLHELECLTAEQVAEVLGSSVATAKIRIHRGRVRLRAALEDQCRFYRDPANVLRCDRKA